MIPFKDIYKKADKLIDDPLIRKARVEDTVKWEKMMYPYLDNGINKLTNPTKIAFLLVDQTEPEGQIETFNGAGSATYTTSADFVPKTGCDFSFLIGDKYDKGATFANGTVTFSRNVPIGTKCSVEWYHAGCFNSDFQSATANGVPADVIIYKVKNYLSTATALAWAEEEKNNLLDIKNTMTNDDFKFYSPANSIRAKIEWVDKLIFNFDTELASFGWQLYSRKYTGGNFYG